MAARLDVRTWTALPAAGSALDARQALDVGRAARRADLGRRSRGVRRSTLRQALDVAARLDVRTWTSDPGPVVRGHNAHAVRWSVPSPWSLASWWRHLGVRVGVVLASRASDTL